MGNNIPCCNYPERIQSLNEKEKKPITFNLPPIEEISNPQNLNFQNIPIIKLQKTFRGYILRKKFSVQKSNNENNNDNNVINNNSNINLNLKNLNELKDSKNLRESEAFLDIKVRARNKDNTLFLSEEDKDSKFQTEKFENENERTLKAIKNFDISLRPGKPIKIEEIIVNNKIIETEKQLGNLVIEEKELIEYIQQNKHRLRKECLKYEDSSIYMGYFNSYWEKEGYGVYILKDGSKYQGFFDKNKMNGRGRLVGIDGDYYEGEFKDDKANNIGKYVNKKGGIYVGNWLDDKQHGFGEEILFDGSYYKGEYLLAHRQGHGKFIWKDGSYYEGDFVKNEIQGNGFYKWREGKTYIGNWENNKMNGKGLFLWKDKKKYYGQYKNDKKIGLGVFQWPDGRQYRGEWKYGKQDGFGIFKMGKTLKYGEWKNGKRIRWVNKRNIYMMDLIKNINSFLEEKNIPKIVMNYINDNFDENKISEEKRFLDCFKGFNNSGFENNDDKEDPIEDYEEFNGDLYLDFFDYKFTNFENNIKGLTSNSSGTIVSKSENDFYENELKDIRMIFETPKSDLENEIKNSGLNHERIFSLLEQEFD